MSSADEGAAGISASLGDEGTALQQAQDKIATMQARAGALDELRRPGLALEYGDLVAQDQDPGVLGVVGAASTASQLNTRSTAKPVVVT